MKIIRMHKHNHVFFEMMQTEEGKARLVEMTKAHNEWLAGLKKEGKYITGYFMPGSGESVHIFEAQSEADIESFRLGDPLEMTLEMDLRVGISIDDHLNIVMERDDT